MLWSHPIVAHHFERNHSNVAKSGKHPKPKLHVFNAKLVITCKILHQFIAIHEQQTYRNFRCSSVNNNKVMLGLIISNRKIKCMVCHQEEASASEPTALICRCKIMCKGFGNFHCKFNTHPLHHRARYCYGISQFLPVALAHNFHFFFQIQKIFSSIHNITDNV